MSEIIQIQVGQCGNQLGSAFWETICQEHEIDSTGFATEAQKPIHLQRVAAFFSLLENGRFIPHSVLVDMEPSALHTIQSKVFGDLYKPENFISGSSGSGNNWAKGHYTEGAELADSIMDVTRKEAEICDCLQGFQIVHSLGGGTGSGLGTLLLTLLKDEYPDRIMTTYSVFPSAVSNSVLEPYNTLLSLNQLVEFADQCITFDNDALSNICQRQFKINYPAFEEMNHIAALAMSGVTSSLRFPGLLNNNLRKLAVNMVPFPRLHFYTVGIAPLNSLVQSRYQRESVQDILRQQFAPSNVLCTVNPQRGRYLTGSCMVRGNVSTNEVEETIFQMIDRNSRYFVEWIPNNIQISICATPPTNIKLFTTFLGNSTCISTLWRRITSQFSKLMRSRAYLHWYTREGMSEEEFYEAHSNIVDLISEYQQHEQEDISASDLVVEDVD